MQQLAQELTNGLLVDKVDIIQGQDEALLDLGQIVEQVARQHGRRGHGRRVQQRLGLELQGRKGAEYRCQQITHKTVQVVVGFVQREPGTGAAARLQPHAG